MGDSHGDLFQACNTLDKISMRHVGHHRYMYVRGAVNFALDEAINI